MKIVIDLEDFYLEDDESLIPALQDHVTRTVVNQISTDIKKQVDKLVDETIKVQLQSEMDTRVKIHVEEFLKTGTIKDRYNSGALIPVATWLADNIKLNTTDIHKWIGVSAQNSVNELKNRYDMLFATQIVTKLNEQGMLKGDIANLLLNSDKGE